MNYTNKKHGDKARINILNVIIAYISEHGYPPTVREICMLSGLKSTSSVHSHLRQMLESGMIESDADTCSSRAIRVPNYKFIKVD